MHPADKADMTAALKQLQRSDKGRNAIQHVLAWMDDGGVGLDYQNQSAIQTLIALCWRMPGSTRDAMREVTGVPYDQHA